MRLGLRVPRTANNSSAADAVGNSDQSRATVPVTKGAATLVPLKVTRLARRTEAGNIISGTEDTPHPYGIAEV